jgi:hypothetical protein
MRAVYRINTKNEHIDIANSYITALFAVRLCPVGTGRRRNAAEKPFADSSGKKHQGNNNERELEQKPAAAQMRPALRTLMPVVQQGNHDSAILSKARSKLQY